MKMSVFWVPVVLTLSGCVYGQMEDDTSADSTRSNYCDQVLDMICYDCAPGICSELAAYMDESDPSDDQCQSLYYDYCYEAEE